MKKILFSFFLMGIPCILYSQLKIESPKTGLSTAPYITVKFLEINDTATILDFHTTYRPNWWIQIPKSTYIQPEGDSTKLYVKATEGIPLAERYFMPESGETEYRLIFPPVDPSAASIDYGEEEGKWRIFNIQINEDSNTSLIPEELYGNWFKDGQKWMLSLFDTSAVFDMQVWNYSNMELKKRKGFITLMNESDERTIYYRKGRGGNIFFGESPENLSEFSRSIEVNSTAYDQDNAHFPKPFFRNDTAVLKGYIKGYTPRIGIKTGTIYINDVIQGDQKNILLYIHDDGSFQAKVPLYHPQTVFFRSEIFSGEAFLEPGQELFVLYDPFLSGELSLSANSSSLFMGKNSEVNMWYSELKDLRVYNPKELTKDILDISCEDYKSELIQHMNDVLRELETISKERGMSRKAYQLIETYIRYNHYTVLLSYEMYVTGEYRKKTKKSVRRINEIPGKKDLEPEHFDFLTADIVHDPYALISSNYYFFINRLKFLDILIEKYDRPYLSEVFEMLNNNGYALTPVEKKLDSIYQLAETEEYIAADKKFTATYQGKLSGLYSKDIDLYRKLRTEETNENLVNVLVKKLEENGISLTIEERDLVDAYNSFYEKECVRRYHELTKPYQKEVAEFYRDRKEELNEIYSVMRAENIRSNLEDLFHIPPGLATDIMYAQDRCRSIVTEYNPVSDEKLREIQKPIMNPYIAQYIAISNEAVKKQIELNKSKRGYIVHDVPESESAKLFENIIKKYKGKVVYIDFWATWCGPCRSGIQNIMPLKDELKGQEVAFVYITGPSSPKKTWENMIPDIKGEHYYLSEDQWNQITAMFNVTGIPHYFLVNKEGNIVNPHLPHMSNGSLKDLLMKHVKE